MNALRNALITAGMLVTLGAGCSTTTTGSVTEEPVIAPPATTSTHTETPVTPSSTPENVPESTTTPTTQAPPSTTSATTTPSTVSSSSTAAELSDLANEIDAILGGVNAGAANY